MRPAAAHLAVRADCFGQGGLRGKTFASRDERARPCDYHAMTTASMYAEFAVREARGISPTYERLSLAVSGDEEILALLDRVPPAKRQPNLLLGVVRFLGGPVNDPAAFHDFTVANWPAVEAGPGLRPAQRWWCSTRPCCIRCHRRAERRSRAWYANYQGTGSR